MTKDSKSDAAVRIQNFETDAAMQLVHAFHGQLHVDPLLGLFYRQAAALANIAGLTFERRPGKDQAGFNRDLGDRCRHSARYNLQWPESDLGSLAVYFERPAPEHDLSTVEDLIALMAGALKNALSLADRELTQGPRPAPTLQQSSERQAMNTALATEDKRDSLVLIAIDNFDALRERSGEIWAQTVIDSTQAMLRETLRDADGVFQIRTGLLAVLLPRTTSRQASAVAEKIRVRIAAMHLANSDVPDQLTACMGIATSRADDSARGVLSRAEDALRLAQLSGPSSISTGRLKLVAS